jgi:uncharacterized OB-fold protein
MQAGYDKPLPAIDALTQGYWEHARGHRLAVQKCCSCGDRHFPPSPVCPRCLSDVQEWEATNGRGTLLSWVRFHRAYWKGWQEELPYDVCAIRLDAGPVIVSNFAGALPTEARMGLPMEAVFDDVTPEVSLVRFRPLGGPGSA